MAEECDGLLPGVQELIADKAHDTNAIRTFLTEQRVKVAIPGKSNRKNKIRHDKKTCKLHICEKEKAGTLADLIAFLREKLNYPDEPGDSAFKQHLSSLWNGLRKIYSQ
jgi:hypothetical protein